MREKGKKCICKHCEDCNFFQSWDMTGPDGLRKSIRKCSFQVLFEEIPRLRREVNGAQAAAEAARNRAQALIQMIPLEARYDLPRPVVLLGEDHDRGEQ